MLGMWGTFDKEQDDDLVRALARQELQNRQGLGIAKAFGDQQADRERSEINRDTLEMNRESRAESADIRRQRAETEAEDRNSRVRERTLNESERLAALKEADRVLADPAADPDMKRAANAVKLRLKPTVSIADNQVTRVPIMRVGRGGSVEQIGETDSNAKIVNEPAPPSARARGELTPTAEANLINRLSTQYMANTKSQRETLGQYAKMAGNLEAYERGEFTARDPMAQTLLVTFQKILDPISVVRESEYDRTIEGQAFLARIVERGKALIAGGPAVSDAALREYLKSAKIGVGIAKQIMDEERQRIGRVADRYEIPQELVFATNGGAAQVPAPGAGEAEPPASAPATSVGPAPTKFRLRPKAQ